MAKTRVVKSTGRFRQKYGGTLRARVREVELKRNAPHKCPICETRGSVFRVSAGIWTCHKCGGRFAGGAYTPKTQVAVVPVRVQAAPAAAAEPVTSPGAPEESE